MGDCSSEEAPSINWESQSGLESSSDLDYLSDRDSEPTPAAKNEPAFTVIEVTDLETIQASWPSWRTASSSNGHLVACQACCALRNRSYTHDAGFALCTEPQPAVFSPQDTALQQVMSIVGCNRSTARALLMHFRWDVDSLCGRLRRHLDNHMPWATLAPLQFGMPSRVLAMVQDGLCDAWLAYKSTCTWAEVCCRCQHLARTTMEATSLPPGGEGVICHCRSDG